MNRILRALLTFLCLVGTLSGCAASRVATSGPDAGWIWRGDRPTPATPAEKLAVTVLERGRQPQSDGKLRAAYEGEEQVYSLVTVEEIPEDPTQPVKAIMFRLRGTKLVYETPPQYFQDLDPSREEHAREVAFQAKAGTLPSRPEIYGDYLYRPRLLDKCTVEVEEVNTQRQVVWTYTITVCAEASAQPAPPPPGG